MGRPKVEPSAGPKFEPPSLPGRVEGAGKEGRVGPTAFPRVPWPEALVVPPPWEGGDGKAINEQAKSGDALPTKHSGTAGVKV